MPGSIRNVPNYIQAGSPSGLRRLMFRNNLKTRKEFRYFDISFDGKKWTAWFYEPVTDEEIVEGKDGSTVKAG